jgi:hypothetical protein
MVIITHSLHINDLRLVAKTAEHRRGKDGSVEAMCSSIPYYRAR